MNARPIQTRAARHMVRANTVHGSLPEWRASSSLHPSEDVRKTETALIAWRGIPDGTLLEGWFLHTGVLTAALG